MTLPSLEDKRRRALPVRDRLPDGVLPLAWRDPHTGDEWLLVIESGVAVAKVSPFAQDAHEREMRRAQAQRWRA